MVPSQGVKSQVVLQKKDNEAVKKHTHTSLKIISFYHPPSDERRVRKGQDSKGILKNKSKSWVGEGQYFRKQTGTEVS